MRCALALSALLLLLSTPPLLPSSPSPSPSQNATQTTTDSSNKTAPTPASNVTIMATDTAQQSTVPTSKANEILASVKATTLGVSSDSPGTTTLAQQVSGLVNTTVARGGGSGNPTTTTESPKSTKSADTTTVATSTATAKPNTTSSQNGAEDTTNSGGKSSHSVTTDLTSTKAEHLTTPHPPSPLSPRQPTSTHPMATPTSSGHDHLMKISSSSSTVAIPGYTFTSPGMTATLQTVFHHVSQAGLELLTSGDLPTLASQSAGITASSVISQRTQQTSSQMPASSTAPSSQETVQPTSPATALRTPTLPETMSSSPTAASTTHRYPKTPSPTVAHESNWAKCEDLETQTQSEKQLILNLTGNTLCKRKMENPGSLPDVRAGGTSDEKLISLICRAVKATFNPAQDECGIRLAPVPGSQTVVVKEITIHTKLPAKDVYERLKDKWDELKEAGVSDMKLGDQGPPEEAEDRFSMPLIITIVCMASFLLLVAALYGCCHQRLSQRKDQQRLTEELQTVENGYHDNPTLEVMETSSEMQEKKVVSLNGELGDSWIVPLDNLTKDDLDEEEDTHL
ncbi:podocalyxin isoform X2 [Pan paniscus]|uniref:podocalyxin isoform X2 n=1 Tax=Pan paniscus TaxID=9597 RepID=UPI0025464E0D|nr:podocalyxin isoform X2 [Pan paniscus]